MRFPISKPRNHLLFTQSNFFQVFVSAKVRNEMIASLIAIHPHFPTEINLTQML
jgi:hypothetical protein